MAENKQEVPVVIERRYDETIASIVNTLQLVIIALTLAFIVRAFFVEAFRIPTGSMAETLSGAHLHIRCDMCGSKYDLGYDTNITSKAKCPNCQYQPSDTGKMPVSHGDRIFVIKSIYQFADPQRWDVVVFRNPDDPEENYIKRMIGKPGEKLELIDGDVYINGVIQRKPEHVQDELWVQIFNTDYQPYIGHGGSLPEDDVNGAFSWEMPFVNDENSKWQIDPRGSSDFVLDSEPGKFHTLIFDSSHGEKFRATYAYNNSSRYRIPPFCSDLKIEFYADVPAGQLVRVGVILSKNGRDYQASVDGSGLMLIQRLDGDIAQELARPNVSSSVSGKVKIKFANVDHKLIFEVGRQKLVYDLGMDSKAAGYKISAPGTDSDEIPESIPRVCIVGAGNVVVSNVAIYRDIYYIDGIRARPGKPFAIDEDEFFVCGDNSNDSYDSRKWYKEGKGNSGKSYRKGIVPREYLVGKAFYLYWGDAFKPFGNALPLIPNFSETKRIYGGVKRNANGH